MRRRRRRVGRDASIVQPSIETPCNVRHATHHARRDLPSRYNRAAVYTWMLFRGKGARDPSTGKWLPTTENQRWCWWLSLGLIFYNNPVRNVTRCSRMTATTRRALRLAVGV